MLLPLPQGEGWGEGEVSVRRFRAGRLPCGSNHESRPHSGANPSPPLAGLPKITTFSGKDRVTTAPFAIMELLPIFTPFKIFTFDPISTFSPISTLPVLAAPLDRRSGCKS